MTGPTADPSESPPLTTVCIPTFNGERFLPEVLEAVFAQTTRFAFEVLVIDSGSSDRTLEILRAYPIRLVEIPNEEFGHGRTRNLAVDLANGQLVAFLTQDATPATKLWLQQLVDAFDAAPDVAAAYGPHLPRVDADPKMRRDLVEFFAGMGPRDRTTIHRRGDIVFFSDVNSCLRKDVWKQIPFRDIPYAEDQAFGNDILEAGYAKAFEPRAAVVHSHSFPPLHYLRRMYDEWKGLKVATGAEYSRRLTAAIYLALKGIRRDLPYVLRVQDASFRQRLRWAWIAVTANVSRNLTAYLVEHESRVPRWLDDRLSYERGLTRKLRGRLSLDGR